MAVTFFWRCESGMLDAVQDFNANNATEVGTLMNTPAISATAAKVGSNGLLIAGVDAYRFDAATSNVNRLTGSYASWLNVQTWASARAFFVVIGSFFEYSIGLQMVGADQLRLRINDQSATLASSFDTTAANLVTGNWYVVSCSWDQPNNKRRIRVYNSDKSLRHEAEDTTTGFSAPADLVATDGIYVGEGNFLGSATYYQDNVFFGDAYNDADTFLANIDIASFTQYALGGGGTPIVGTGRRMQSVIYS